MPQVVLNCSVPGSIDVKGQLISRPESAPCPVLVLQLVLVLALVLELILSPVLAVLAISFLPSQLPCSLSPTPG